MADAPVPDLHVDAVLVARLVAAQHPDLAGPVRLVANGWDNAIFRLGDRYGVRMPRRALAVGLALNEHRWLPQLAPRLPVAIPSPVRVGRPTPELGYEAPWSIVPWLAGESAVGFDAATRGVAAAALAAFVADLGVPAPRDAPANPYRGVPLAARDADVRARLASGRVPGAARLGAVWERALAASVWPGPDVWLHGDLHPANLLLAPSGALTAVVDFGDVTAGDPATDLATAWLTFDVQSRRIFREEIERRRGVDAATWDRARGWALLIASAVVAQAGTSSAFGRMGASALEQVLLD
ncbi:aminoglycoside phosphotransferase family protein [Agromyces sp. NPDC058484]|uniref:aminoglycoside phosphotransferase family protein n=1 Tax=Agromyces sp. NPDC058484 TaxID=3346524 RepID=UPI0036539FF1